MDKFDRALQREILSLAIDSYPAYVGHKHPKIPDKYKRLKKSNSDLVLININYLHEHKLISLDEVGHKTIGYSAPYWIKATAQGIDFMLNDGGLSAILSVTTIKLHRDVVVVLEDLIALSNMTDAEKEKAKSTLGELSLEALKAVVQTATAAGLSALTK
ncbi:hypothetical protein [Pectobacterium polaris]|uniref:hypothetical protein n=1 Tax=Pectobacterium polaris TaxID=2042057 RepID=UPI0032EE927B